MKTSLIFTAIAPIALLAACSDDAETADPIDNADAELATSPETTSTTTAAADTGPMKPTKVAEAGDFSGTYSIAAGDGKTSRLTLDSKAGTYSYVAEDGQTRTGKYTLSDDGYRFIINDYNGRPGYFTLSDGFLVRLPTDVVLEGDNITVTGERFDRDKEVFSREPELGSPVVPADMVKQPDR
jgi:hypothetical protein